MNAPRLFAWRPSPSGPGRRRGPVLVALLALAVVVTLRALDPGFVAGLRNLTFDAYQRLQPRPYGDPPVRIVAIDDEALSAVGQWPWPRTRMAELAQRLVDMGAATVAFAVIFAEPDRLSPAQVVRQLPDSVADERVRTLLSELPDNDRLFADAIQPLPTVLSFATSLEPNDRRPQLKTSFAYASAEPTRIIPPFFGATPPLAELERAARGIGGISLTSGQTGGVVRRVPLYFTDGAKLYPSLAVEALRVVQGARTVTLRGTGASGEFGAGRDSLIDTRVGDLIAPMTGIGEFWVYFDQPRPQRQVSARDILDSARHSDELRARIEGHVVLVGVTATGLADSWATPLGDSVPGVALHAQVIEQIIGGSFLTRPDWADGLETVATIVAGLLVLVLALLVGPRLSLAVGAIMVAAAVGASWSAFSQASLLFDPVYPSIGALAVHLSVTGMLFISTDRERRFVRKAFGQYLAPQLLSELEKAPGRMVLGGELRPLTIMFMDVRDFTPISEAISATELVHFLNTLLSPLSDAIQGEGGTIDKYIGDSIMAFWNAPLDVEDHAAKACTAALAMRRILAQMNASDAFGFAGIGRQDLVVKIGIGLNTGEACVGNMGSLRRFNYSAVGDAVNISARIESASKSFGTDILVSEDTATAAPGFALLEVDEVLLKGKAKPVKLFALYGDAATAVSPAFAALQADHGRMMTALRAGRLDEAAALAARCRAAADPWFGSLYDKFAERCRAPETQH